MVISDNGIPVRILREMKYISDQRGIINRYYEESKGWNEHLQNSRSFVLDKIRQHRPEKVIILGSGWLLDVPLEALLAACNRIYLADIHHPLQVQHKLKKIENVRLISTDISGGAVRQVYQLVKQYRKEKVKRSLDTIALHSPELPEADYCVSLNLLNQLDIMLVDYIKRYISYSEDELTGFRKRIQEHHLSFLRPGASCFITDVKEIIINRRKQVKREKSLVHVELPEGRHTKSWTWKFDRKEYNPGFDTHLEVIAVEL